MQKRKLRLSMLILLVVCTVVCALSACKSDNVSKSSYIISFNSKGGTSVDTIYLKEGESIALPSENPTRPGYVFTGWYLDNECSEPLNGATFKAKRNLTIFAGWESVNTYRHAISINNQSDYGTIEIIEPEDKRARKGDEVIIEVKCNNGYIIEDGTLNANGILLTQSDEKSVWYTFVMPAEPVTVTCRFEAEPLSVEVYEGIKNGIIIPSAEYARLGDQVTLLVIPDYGYKLKSLYFVGGDAIKTYIGNVGSFYMGNSEVIIGADFEPINNLVKYNVKTETDGAGSVDVDKTDCEAGLYVNVDAVPADGYRLTRLTVEYDGNSTILSGQTFVMPSSDATVKAYFAKIGTKDNDYELTLSDTPNGKLNIINRKNYYKSGENITFTINPDNGYVIDGVYANGLYVAGNSFRMPSADCNLTARFIRAGYSIKVAGTAETAFISILSTELAYPGDRVYVDIVPDSGYAFVKETLRLSDGTPITDGSFIMPDSDVEICAEVIRADKTYSVTISDAVGGTIVADKTYASRYEVVNVSVVPDTGYALTTNGLTLCYTEGNETVNKLIDSTFLMPEADVTVCASFERVYTVSAYDNGKIFVYPSTNVLKIGQRVSYNINTYGDYIAEQVHLTVTIGSYNEDLDSSLVFELTSEKCKEQDADITLSVTYADKTINKWQSYPIVIRSTSGGTVTSSKASSVSGTLVSLEITPDKGFELDSLELSVNGSVTSITDVFVMPDATAEIIATFTQKAEESFIFGLKNSYLNNLSSFEALGFKLNYLRSKHLILQYFGNKAKNVAGYLNGAIEVKSSYGHDFYLFEVNDMAEISRLSYIFAEIIGERYNNDLAPSVYIKNGYLIISPNGNAEEDWYVYRNKLIKFGSFLIYERENGTYGLFAYAGNGGYVSIPKSFNGRTISYIAPYAFSGSANILGLDLGYVSELDNFALCGLNKIGSLELRNVQYIGIGTFKGTTELKEFSISSFNTAFNVENGVLYDSGYSTLIAYPSAKTAETYSLKTQVSAIADYAFYGAKCIKRLGYLGKLTKIGNYAFADCKSLTTVCYDVISGINGVADFASGKSSVATIGDYAFNGAVGLVAFNLDTVTYIGKYAFKLEHNEILNININNNSVLPSAFYDIVENSTDGSLRVSISKAQSDAYFLHPIWSKYTPLII